MFLYFCFVEAILNVIPYKYSLLSVHKHDFFLYTTSLRDNFPRFACLGDLILSKFQNKFFDCSAQPEKNVNWGR